MKKQRARDVFALPLTELQLGLELIVVVQREARFTV
jgi:hypothetical protein